MPTAGRISESIYLHPGRYQQKVYTPKWDIFINYEGDEYITRERQTDGAYKWRKAYGYNLEGSNWYNKNGMSMYIFLQKVADRYRSSLEQKKKDLLVFASGRKDVKSAMRIKK